MKRLLCKGDSDVGITIDVKQAAKNIDTVTLLSGDADFDMLLEKLNDYGLKVLRLL